MRKLLTLLMLFTLIACQSESRNKNGVTRSIELVTPSGEIIQTTLAITPAEQEQGLSGVKPDDFSDNQGMLFYYLEDGDKYFWMPDTYFALDLIYLDKDLKILDIIRKLPHYVGRANPDLIPRARPVWSRHTLEMKASSPVSQKLKIGDVLKWRTDDTLESIDTKIRGALNNN